MTTVTYEAFAYMADCLTLEDISGGQLPTLTTRESPEYVKHGFALIGKASITLKLESADKIIQGQMDALNHKLQTERAESQQRQNAILNQISKLSALSFAGAEMNCEVGE